MNLNSILIGSEDPKRLTEYYTKLFGKPGTKGATSTAGRSAAAGMTVGPHDQVKGKNPQPGRVIWNSETPDVKADFAKLRSGRASVVGEPYEPGGGADMLIATLSDPDDNYFQLMSPM